MPRHSSKGPATLKVSLVDVDSVRCHEKNPRGHDHPQIQLIAQSLKKFGQQKAIVLAANGVDIIAGNGTFTAAKSLGWSKINVHVSSLTRDEALAYMIADNRTGEKSHWEKDVLTELLQELQEQDDDLLEATGFDLDEILNSDNTDLDEICSAAANGPLEATDCNIDEHPSNLKVVQLFLDKDTHPVFMSWIQVLANQYETHNVTDTVMAVVENAYDKSDLES